MSPAALEVWATDQTARTRKCESCHGDRDDSSGKWRLIKCKTCTRRVHVGLECSGPSPPTDMQKQGRQDYHCAWCKDLRVDGPRKRQSRTLDPVNAGQPTISDRGKRDGDKAGAHE